MNREVVSSEDELLILVGEADQPLGSLSKVACHDGAGVLHRAFSVFLFDDANRLLVQRRHSSKRLWPLYWANSCCSHPRWGESMELATERRLHEELGLKAELTFAYRFEYQASFGDLGSEHELCSVYLGRSSPQALDPNSTEIAETRWLSLEEVDAWMSSESAHETLAPWFRLEWKRFRSSERALLEAFLLTPV